MKKMKKLVCFILLLTGHLVQAQFVTNYKKVADTYFENKDYYAASTFYKKALKITGDSAQVLLPYVSERKTTNDDRVTEDYQSAIYKLAESSRMYREFNEAEKYYGVAVTFTDPRYANAQFYYAEALRANKKFMKAVEAFEKFIRKNPSGSLTDEARKEIASCKFAIAEMRFPRMVWIKKVQQEINALGSNYAPVKVADAFYFTSSRPVSGGVKKDIIRKEGAEVPLLTKNTPFVNQIYRAKDALSQSDISVSWQNLNLPKNTEAAAAGFSPDGNTIYFTGWTDQSKYALYRAKRTGSSWSDPEPLGLEINSKDFNSSQPFVTSDGKYLLFSSDRMGGYGKFDIWYCTIRDDGTFGQPVNLGPAINTADDERAPYYNVTTKKLLFSSDGRVGLGGLDFFESEGDLINWTKPKNMGYPFNSSKDDVYFTALDNSGQRGYISSDRESSCCLEVFEVKRESLMVTGTLTDCKTNGPLEGVSVSLMNEEGQRKAVTGSDGRYTFQVDSKRPVKLYFAKDNYFGVNKNYAYEELARADTLMTRDYCLSPFKLGIPMVLDNIYYAFDSADLTEPSKKVLDFLIPIMEDNPQMEIELSAHTDNVGADEYNLDLSNRRAQSCVDYLVSKGIAASRLTAKGYGESMPVAPNTKGYGKKKKDNPEGRAKNRRTEFKVTKQ